MESCTFYKVSTQNSIEGIALAEAAQKTNLLINDAQVVLSLCLGRRHFALGWKLDAQICAAVDVEVLATTAKGPRK